MPKLTSVGFIPPPDFPVEAHNKVHQCLNKYKDTHNVQWSLFGSGWNGLAYRYSAMAEYDNDFTSSVKKFGNSPPSEERHNQEKALFGFFVSAISTIDCFFFSSYCIASILKPNAFPLYIPDDLEFNSRNVASKFHSEFCQDPFSTKMRGFFKQSKYWEINEMRNVLTHRGMPPRRFYRGGERDGLATMPVNPKAPSNQWQFDLPVDAHTTTSRRLWLCDTLKILIDSSVDFCTRQI